jgi:hypothetical protein
MYVSSFDTLLVFRCVKFMFQFVNFIYNEEGVQWKLIEVWTNKVIGFDSVALLYYMVVCIRLKSVLVRRF